MLEATLNLLEDIKDYRIFCIINNEIGDTVIHQRIDKKQLPDRYLKAGLHKVVINLPSLWLYPGVYTVYFKLVNRGFKKNEKKYVSERIIIDIKGNIASTGGVRAFLNPDVQWKICAV